MFSNAVKLENLNDYNNDAEECIKPFLYKSQIVNDNDFEKPNLISIHKKNKKRKGERAQISLTDCLACSGCVTNEETTFLKSQNAIEIINTVKKKKINIISLSLQSVTALSVYYHLSISETQNKLCFFFKSLNFNYVYDSSLAELITLNEAKNEFIHLFRTNNPELGKKGNDCSYLNRKTRTNQNSDDILKKKKQSRSSFSRNHDARDDIQKKLYRGNITTMNGYQYTHDYAYNYKNNYNPLEGNKSGEGLPLICSHCSGSVIYAEKNFDDDLLNSLSKIRSSQDIQGIMLKCLHMRNSIYTLPLIKNSLFTSFFQLYNHRLKFMNTCRKYFLKNHNLLKETIDNYECINDEMGRNVRDIPNISIYDINHVYLLYCFDKKLEAHRNNPSQKKAIDNNINSYLSYFHPYEEKTLNRNKNSTNDKLKTNFYCVDSVLTTVELVELINNMHIDFPALPELPIDSVYRLLRQTPGEKLPVIDNSCIKGQTKEGVNKEREKNEKNAPNCGGANGGTYYNIHEGKTRSEKSLADSKKELTARNSHEEVYNTSTFPEESKDLVGYIYNEFSNKIIRCGDKNNISMGYGEEMFKFVCKEIFNFHIEDSNFNLKYQDIIVLSLFERDICVFRVVLSYGFKSMYNVLQKLRERKIEDTMVHKASPMADVALLTDEKGVKTYNMQITYNLQFSGRIDYVELMACEKGCLFGCAQNIFSERIQNFSSCSCYNLRIFKKVAEQEEIENFDFLFPNGDNAKGKNDAEEKLCGIHCIYCSTDKQATVPFQKEEDSKLLNNKQTFEYASFGKMEKDNLFKKLYDTMHCNKFTIHINSANCVEDMAVNSFLKKMYYVFNTGTFHIFKGTFSSKKKQDIINW
ncbi:cytosolic Fe-S cluster assembly factor NAR1, putative [Plasmodium ovale]|uniref:Cytosolic Fe-S cluster assembly factor NAR1, putative n=2 Tax=Plasmodium ovale TaxID=36330 RepID=A0A1D3TJN8_PLAOA|nr:cytosolic Fe-S cluster assembly factor NAR1, putative (NAR1) [Plasmodium ovale curtisi]SCP05122.1 cytosolic Fe-S cluster assembly factor NAR1, putative [Plasmodium ovale]